MATALIRYDRELETVTGYQRVANGGMKGTISKSDERWGYSRLILPTLAQRVQAMSVFRLESREAHLSLTRSRKLADSTRQTEERMDADRLIG